MSQRVVLDKAREPQRRLTPGLEFRRPAEKGATLKVGIGQLVLSLVGGVVVATFYFGGLWVTVRRVPTSRRPVLLTFGSFALRGAVTVATMVWIARMHWQWLLAAMASFVLVRVILIRKLRPEDPAMEVKDGS